MLASVLPSPFHHLWVASWQVQELRISLKGSYQEFQTYLPSSQNVVQGLEDVMLYHACIGEEPSTSRRIDHVHPCHHECYGSWMQEQTHLLHDPHRESSWASLESFPYQLHVQEVLKELHEYHQPHHVYEYLNPSSQCWFVSHVLHLHLKHCSFYLYILISKTLNRL